MAIDAISSPHHLPKIPVATFSPPQVYNPGEQLVLGGPGLADVMDTMYLVAFQREKTNSAAREGAMSILPKSLRRGDLHDFGFWLQQLIKSVRRNRMTEVMIIVETGGWL